MEMEARGDLRLRSILPLLPAVLRGGAFLWSEAVQEKLRTPSLGPDVSRVASGDALADALPRLPRQSLALPAFADALPPLPPRTDCTVMPG